MTIRNYFAYLLMFYIASTLIFSLGSNIVITRILNVMLIISFIVYLFLNKTTIKLHIPRFLWFYIFFTLFSLLSIFWSIDTTSSINRSIIIIIIAINLLFIFNIVKYFDIERYILYGLLLGALYNYLILFDIISYISEYTLHFKHRFVGTANNPNTLAIYMLLSMVSSILLIKEIKNKFLLYLLVLNIPLAIYTIIMTASKKGIIFAVFLLGIYLVSLLKLKKTMVWSIFIIIGIIYLLNSGLLLKIEGVNHLVHRFSTAGNAIASGTTSGSTYERLYLIQAAFDVFSKDFGTILFGTGQQTFALQNKLGLYAHNNYMEIVANLGLIGLFLFYSIYISIFKKVKYLKDKNTKYFLLGFLFVLLLMDNALVSYAFKPIFFMFIFIVIYVEKKSINNKGYVYEKN